MESYLYYKRDAEWVRVIADSYAREYASQPASFSGGQCAIDYRVFVTYDRYYKGRLDREGDTRTSPRYFRGPIRRIWHDIDASRDIKIDHGNSSTNILVDSLSSPTTFKNIRNVFVTPRSGGPDNCGNVPGYGQGECSTVFTRGDQQVLTLTACPEVTDGRGCDSCCRQLLTIAKAIKI